MPTNILTFKPTDGLTLEISGIHVRHSETYFTNLATSQSRKVTITAEGGAASAIWVLTTNVLVADGFVLPDIGGFYALRAIALWQVSADGRTAASDDFNSTVLQGKTSARFDGSTGLQRILMCCMYRREAVYSKTYLDRQYMEDVCWRRMPTRLFLVAKEIHAATVFGRREQHGSVE